MANLYSNWFLKTILSPFRTISNVIGFSTLSIPTLNSQATCFENECCAAQNICIHLSILQLPQSLEIHLPEHGSIHSSICMSFTPWLHWFYACQRAYWLHSALKFGFEHPEHGPEKMKAACLFFTLFRGAWRVEIVYALLPFRYIQSNSRKKDQLI